jgi:hypothetical protein
MTLFSCSVCGKVHTEPPCLQVFTINIGDSPKKPVRPLSVRPSDEMPWVKRYWCGECKRELQPPNGFSYLGMHIHSAQHAENRLREVLLIAGQCRSSLDSIDGYVTNWVPGGWYEGMPAATMAKFIQYKVDNAIRRDQST